MADDLRGSVVAKGKKYYIVVDLDRSADGKRRQKWFSDPAWTTKKQAEKDLPRILLEVGQGIQSLGEHITVDHLLERWYSTRKLNLRESSFRSYQWAIKHVSETFGARKINKISTIQLQDFINEKIRGGISNTSGRMLYTVLNQIFIQAKSWKLISDNPMEGVERPRRQDFEATIYSAPEMQRLVKASEGTTAHIAIMLGVTCGLRRGEVCALRWQDVDLANGRLYIEHTVYEGKGLQPVKTDRSHRAITLPVAAIRALEQQLQKQQQLRESAGPAWQELGFVLAREDGMHYSPTYIWRQFRTIAAAAGLPDARFHDLRHSHATFLLMQNVPIKAVSERLGHASVAFTLQTYSKVLKPMQEAAASAIDAMFSDDDE